MARRKKNHSIDARRILDRARQVWESTPPTDIAPITMGGFPGDPGAVTVWIRLADLDSFSRMMGMMFREGRGPFLHSPDQDLNDAILRIGDEMLANGASAEWKNVAVKRLRKMNPKPRPICRRQDPRPAVSRASKPPGPFGQPAGAQRPWVRPRAERSGILRAPSAWIRESSVACSSPLDLCAEAELASALRPTHRWAFATEAQYKFTVGTQEVFGHLGLSTNKPGPQTGGG